MSEHKPTYEDMEIAYGLDKHFRWWLQARESRIEAAAEQRGAARALREAAHDWEYTLDNIPRTGVEVGDWLHNRADQMEGDNDD